MNDPKMTLDQAQEAVTLATHPKVTKESMTARIKNAQYFFNGTLTLCVIEVVNGFKVVGKSAPASPENFNQEVGERYAYEDAFRSLWQLEGYLLCETLYQEKGAQNFMAAIKGEDGLDV
jgi:hypothetical protein